MTSNSHNILNNTNNDICKDDKNTLHHCFTSHQNDDDLFHPVETTVLEDKDGYRSSNSANDHLSTSFTMTLDSGNRRLDMDFGEELINKNQHSNVFCQHAPKSMSSVPLYDSITHQDKIDNDCYLSKLAAEIIEVKLFKILEKMLLQNEFKLDFQKNECEFAGRIFTSSVSYFVINIYKLEGKSDNNNESIIKIKNIFGDSLEYYNFEELLLKKLQSEKIIVSQTTPNSIDTGLEMSDFRLDDDDECEEIDNNSISFEDNDKELDFTLCEAMIETLYDKNSYYDECIHDAYQFVCYLQENSNRCKNMIDYILKNESKRIIKNLVETLKSNHLHSAFIVLHVLEIIKILLSKENIKSKLTIPKSFNRDICNIYKIWSNPNGIENKLGCIKIKIMRSQQIEIACQSILQIVSFLTY